MPDVPEIVLQDRPPQDLRRVGISPDHWYPLAWSAELKPGRRYAAHFAGEPVVLVRPKDGRGLRARGPLRASAGAAVTRASSMAHYPLLLSRLDLRRVRPAASMCLISATASCRTACARYPCREQAGLIFVWPGDPPLAGASCRRLGSASDTPTRRGASAAGQLPLQVHAREPDGHEPSVSAPQADGADEAALSRAPARRGLGGSRLHALRASGQQPIGEALSSADGAAASDDDNKT